jgi:DNA polymerase-1
MHHFIIDALNLAYRAHNANFELKTASGLYSGMFYGFVRTIFSLKKKYRGYKFDVVWDRKPTHKIALHPEYKAGRTSLTDVIFSQVPDIQIFLKNAGIDQYHEEHQEADDVMASLVQTYSGESGNIIVYSNDKDLLQLVKNGKVTVYKPKVAANPEKFYDEAAVAEQFGVPPEKLACYRSFDGDASDNIVGVNRVPRKIIAGLVNKYSTIEKIYEVLPEQKLTEFQRESMLECKSRIWINTQITTLNRYLRDIQCDQGETNKKNLVDLFDKYEIRSVKPDDIIEIFASSLNIKYTDPRETVKVESFSLFNN